MATKTQIGDVTKHQLLDAAELLFGQHGIDAVSLRSVNAAAGANVAGIHYHFGSKDALVKAVTRRRMGVLGERRLAMLADLPETPSVEDVAATLVMPLAEFSADPEGRGRAYLRVLASVLNGRASMPELRAEAYARQSAPLDSAFDRALPGLSPDLRTFRIELAGRLMVQTLADPGPAGHELMRTQGGHPAMVAALIDSIVGILAAPVTQAAKGQVR